MAMTGLCWSSFIEFMKWVSCWRALDEQRVRLYCLNTCYWWSIQFEVVTSPSRVVQTYCNGDDGSALIFVFWMYGTVSCCRWTNRRYVCIAACVLEFDICYSYSIRYVVVLISPLHAVQIHYNGNAWRLGVDLRLSNVWNGCHFGPGRTACTFYCYLYARIWHVLLLFDILCNTRS